MDAMTSDVPAPGERAPADYAESIALPAVTAAQFKPRHTWGEV